MIILPMFELFTLPFFQRALIIGILLGGLMAILGVIVVLRNMSFFSDAIGHSALAGIAGGLLLGIDPFWGGFFFALLVAIGIAAMKRISTLSLDTLLGVFFSAFVALGVILITLVPGYQADLISFLFGNILTVTRADVALSVVIIVVTVVALMWAGKGFISIALDPALAKAEGVPVARYELILLLLLAGTIALSIKLVGVVLVTALLIIPAASAKNVASSLASMFGFSIFFSFISVVVGLLGSAVINTPSGPTIVLASSVLFIVSLLLRRRSVAA